MVVAIVLAGGKGSRMNESVAKQYIKIEDKEIIYYSLNTFENAKAIDEIVLVCGAEDIEYCKKEIVEKYNFYKIKKIVPGGKERYDSVCNGLKAIKDSTVDIVMIHDGARPFITEKMVNDSIKCATRYNACTVGMPVKDTIKVVNEDGYGVETPDRKKLYQIQTPQTFRYDILLEAYDKMYNAENHNITDDTMLVEQYMGMPVKVIEGSYENIKITTKSDLNIAEIFIKKIQKTC